MCVTNTTFRRTQPISLAQQQSHGPSGLTQRLLGTFQLTAPSKPQGGVVHQSTQQFAQQSSVLQVPTVCALGEKPRPKRRRKPQKPGKTAKMNDRHFVIHNYHDHSNDSEDMVEETDQDHDDEHARRKGGVAVAFPVKLHAILDQVELDGLGHVISWQPHGRCFVIHQPKEFVATVMPQYFRQTKLTSFQRQLNLYGFCRLTRGADAGGYYHELFLRGKTFLCKRMMRTKVKGTKFKAASSPDQEPDFYSMPPVIVTPGHSPHGSPEHHSRAYDDTSASGSLEPAPINMASIFSNGLSAPSLQMQQQQQHLLETYQLQQFPQRQAIQQQVLPVQRSAYEPAPLSFPPNSGNQVLDEAVNELFLNSGSNNLVAEMNDLDDFVRDWEPQNFSQTLNSDMALGFMLDKLLED